MHVTRRSYILTGGTDHTVSAYADSVIASHVKPCKIQTLSPQRLSHYFWRRLERAI